MHSLVTVLCSASGACLCSVQRVVFASLYQSHPPVQLSERFVKSVFERCGKVLHVKMYRNEVGLKGDALVRPRICSVVHG